MKTLIVDLDGVCCDFNTALNNELARMCGVNLRPTYSRWDWAREMYPHNVIEAVWADINGDGAAHFWSNLAPYDREVVERLGHFDNVHSAEVIFLTNRVHRRADILAANWLRRVGKFHNPQVLAVGDKASVAAGLGRVDAVIDDDERNIRRYLRTLGTSARVYVLDQPWNTDLVDPYVIRVKTLEEMLNAEGL